MTSKISTLYFPNQGGQYQVHKISNGSDLSGVGAVCHPLRIIILTSQGLAIFRQARGRPGELKNLLNHLEVWEPGTARKLISKKRD